MLPAPDIAYEYWSEATSYQLGADAALERGDLQAWAEDNTLDDYYSDLGDGAYDQWTGQGSPLVRRLTGCGILPHLLAATPAAARG